MDRRSFMLGFGGLLAAPAIVRATSIMRVSPMPTGCGFEFIPATSEELINGLIIRTVGWIDHKDGSLDIVGSVLPASSLFDAAFAA